MPVTTLLLPTRSRLKGALPAVVSRMLGRADRLPDGEAGERAQLQRHFEILPRGWPVAALTRDLDAGDAAQSRWLRADPAWVRADINGARLMAIGAMLQVDADDIAALLPALRPVCGDFGLTLDAPRPDRWYLRLPLDSRLPGFTPPDDALGSDLFDHLVGTDAASVESRRWRSLASDVQVVLHNHPWNARRTAAGKPPVNALWFWGGGVLPDHVRTQAVGVGSDDPVLQALARAAGVAHSPVAVPVPTSDDVLIDLRNPAAGPVVERWLAPLAALVIEHPALQLVLDFADGARMRVRHVQRWRVWRRALTRFDA